MSTTAGATDNPGVVAWPPLLYAVALAVVIVCRWFWPMPIFASGVPNWPGLALVVVAFALMLWGRRTLTAAGTNVDPGRPTTTIVSTGPYRFTRNPLYVGLTLAYLGISLAVNTWWGIVVLVPLVLIVHTGVVRREERYLENKFGDGYRQYRASVRRYL